MTDSIGTGFRAERRCGRGRSVGVGKTTLAHTVTTSLRSNVQWAVCTESSQSIPLGVFAHGSALQLRATRLP